MHLTTMWAETKKNFVKVTFDMIFISTNKTGIRYGCSLMRTSTQFCIESLL